MGFVDESIDVRADVPLAYALWLDYEGYPSFMSGISQVDVVGYCRLSWTGQVCGREVSWETEVVERVEDTRVRWAAVDGRETGEVTFEKLDAGTVRVHYQLEYEPGLWDADEEALRDCLQARLRDDLKEFKVLAESLV